VLIDLNFCCSDASNSTDKVPDGICDGNQP